MNFRNSDCVTARVDYVESVDSAVCGKYAVSYFGACFGRIKSPCVYRSIAILTGKFFARTFCTPPEVASLYIAARKNRRGSSRLRGIQLVSYPALAAGGQGRIRD